MMSEAASDCKTGCNYASSSVAPSPAQKQHRERHRTSWNKKRLHMRIVGQLPWAVHALYKTELSFTAVALNSLL
jgi:hypothetical protein